MQNRWPQRMLQCTTGKYYPGNIVYPSCLVFKLNKSRWVANINPFIERFIVYHRARKLLECLVSRYKLTKNDSKLVHIN